MKIGNNQHPQAAHGAHHTRPTGAPKSSDQGANGPGNSGPGDRADISDRIQETLSHLKDRQPLQNFISNIQGNFSQQ